MLTPNPLPTEDILASGILHAIRHIAGGEPLMLSPEHATHVLEIMQAALHSVETGEAVEIESTFNRSDAAVTA